WIAGEKILCQSEPDSNAQELISTSGGAGGVAVDPTRILYWTSRGRARIEKRSLPDGETEVLATPGATVSAPAGIAVDAKAGRVYWANEGGGREETGAISWAHLDGSGGGDIEIAGATIDAPRGIVLLMAPSVEAPPTISGGSIVGGKPLFCDPGSCAPDEPGGLVFRDASLTAYRWLLEGKQVAGAMEQTLEPQEAGYYTCAVIHANAAGETSAETAAHYVQQPGEETPR
ncbi:MAG TPA: hypothetical protein VFT10_09500, partial [Solirubrobacterales bacterium]|nr:hypothetical protein [Solirubrobacterales bacterium]